MENNAGVNLGADASGVTLFFPNCYTQILPYGSDARGIIDGMIYNLQPGRGGMTCLIFNPVQARALAREGWSKQRIKEFVAEFARVPAYRQLVAKYRSMVPAYEKY